MKFLMIISLFFSSVFANNIQNNVNTITNNAGDTIHSGVSNVQDAVGNIDKNIQGVTGNVKDSIGNISGNIKGSVNDVKGSLSNIGSNIQGGIGGIGGIGNSGDNSTKEIDNIISKEKKVMPLLEDINILRGKILILEKEQILQTYGLIFEETSINQRVALPNIHKEQP